MQLENIDPKSDRAESPRSFLGRLVGKRAQSKCMDDNQPNLDAPDMSRILSVLNKLSSYELWKLSSFIHRMYQDPDRMRVARSKLHIGQSITYYDTKSNKEIGGTIIEIRRSQALVRDDSDGKVWRIPFYMLNVDHIKADIRSHSQMLSPITLSVGDTVGYKDRANNDVYGTVIKLNKKTAELRLRSGESWLVAYQALSRVVECESESS